MRPHVDLSSIALRAASLYERVALVEALQADERLDGDAAPDAASVLRAWQQAFSPGDPAALARRLAWDGLDEATVGRALRMTNTSWLPLPEWTVWLDRIAQRAARLAVVWTRDARSDAQLLDRHAPDRTSPAVARLWIPAVRVAGDLLREQARSLGEPLTDELCAAFERLWLRELTTIGARAAEDFLRQPEPLAGRPAIATSADPTTSARGANGAAAAAADATVAAHAVDLADNVDGSGPTDTVDRVDPRVLRLLHEGLLPLWDAYPVLARQVAILTEHAAGAATELITRLARDRAAIARAFNRDLDPGALIAIEPALSDPHDRRRRVASLTFASGLRLLYKPRDLRLEQLYNDLLTWTDVRGLRPSPRAITVLPRDGYGWVEFVDERACRTQPELRDAFQRAGSLLCLAWLLGGRDLHVENVIATERGPVLIDTEMLFQPDGSLVSDLSTPERTANAVEDGASEARDARDASALADARPRGSCLETGLLTWLQSSAAPGADAGLVDIGGLCGDRGLRNRIRLHDRPQSPAAFADEIRSGFAAAYRLLREQRDELLAADGPLSRASVCRARIAFRPSGHYASVHQVLATPAFQRSGVMRGCALDSLSRLFNTDRECPRLWPLVSAERRALETLDVPRFTIGVDETIVHEGRAVGPVFARSGWAATRERIARLSDADLAWHLATLDDVLAGQGRTRLLCDPPAVAAVATTVDSPWAPRHIASSDTSSNVTARADAYRAQAVWIGRELLAQATREGDALTWPQRRWQLAAQSDAVDAYALYGGALGPALCFAALAAVTSRERANADVDPQAREWRAAVRGALRPVSAWIDRRSRDLSGAMPGIGSGVGSLVYGLVSIDALLAHDSHSGGHRRDNRSPGGANSRAYGRGSDGGHRSGRDSDRRGSGGSSRSGNSVDSDDGIACDDAISHEALALARRVAACWRPEDIADDRALDVISGSAGALLALIALRARLDDSVAHAAAHGTHRAARAAQADHADHADHAGHADRVERARIDRQITACIDHLVRTQISRGDEAGAWRVLDDCVHTGFAHGASGIAYALLRAFELTGRADCLRAATRALRAERALYARTRGEWPVLDVTTAPLPRVAAWMTAWCHGAPGIALARGAARPFLGGAEAAAVDADLQAALAATLARRFTPFDSICCGNFGRIDVLLTLGLQLRRPELLDAAHDMAAAAIARAHRRAHWTLTAAGFEARLFDPGFFQGLSGIGYQLARLADPARVPSVLAFETAVGVPTAVAVGATGVAS